MTSSLVYGFLSHMGTVHEFQGIYKFLRSDSVWLQPRELWSRGGRDSKVGTCLFSVLAKYTGM